MSLYRCQFCKEKLNPDPFRRFEWFALLLAMRPYTCPHCNDGYFRPILSLKKLFGEPRRRFAARRVQRWSGGSGTRTVSAKGTARAISEPLPKLIAPAVEDPNLVAEPKNGEARGEKRNRSSDGKHRESRSRSSGRSSSRRKSSSKSRKKESPSERLERRRKRRRAAAIDEVKEQDRTIAGISAQRRPRSYRAPSTFGRLSRKLSRKVRRMLGLSKRKKKKRRSIKKVTY